MKLEDMSNELLLCIWDQLSNADVIYSFSSLNNHIHRLLLEFCGLYKELDLRYCSLSACRFFCHQVPIMNEWRLNLTVLKLGNRYRCSQTDFFANEVAKSFVARYFEKQCNNSSKDLFRLIIAYNKHLEPLFPQLKSLFVFQSTSLNENCRDILLRVVACGSTMRRFTWRSCSYQTHHSKSFFDWLFRWSVNLNSYRLESPLGEKSFELTYQDTLIKGYLPHPSLTYLTISLLNLSTLEILLHYLPKLQSLDVNISDIIDSTNITDKHLSTNLTYPKELHTLKLRYLSIKGKGCYYLEQLIEKFTQSLENFSLSMYHRCDDEPELYYNGYRLAILCEKLLYLRSLHFAIQIQLFEKANSQTLKSFTSTFSTPFWLNGPFSCKRVCVDFHQLYGLVQMFSLPYTFHDIGLIRTIDLVNIQFNTNNEEKNIPINLSVELESLWCGMNRLFISIDEKQKIPLSFCQALQYSRSQGKILTIVEKRGIIPDKIEDDVQLTHFNTLELNDSIDINTTYNLQELLAWIRLLPNIKCLNVNLVELKHWFTIVHDNQYLHSFLQRIERLCVNCSCIINAKMNEEIMESLLLFLINKDHFSQLRCLRFMNCKNISSAWYNINQWLDFILTRINEHQLKCVRFDFIEKEHEITDLHTDDEMITITDPPCSFDIHRFVQENHIALWIERK